MNKDLKTIILHYTDKNGKFSYDLMNKEFIVFAHRSKIVQNMIDDKISVDEIIFYIVSNKFRSITDNHQLSDDDIHELIAELDRMYSKGIFKELEKELRRMSHVDKR